MQLVAHPLEDAATTMYEYLNTGMGIGDVREGR
jgi:hypothetical protein